MRAIVTNAFGKDIALRPLPAKEQLRIKQFADEFGRYRLTNSVEKFLISLNSVKTFDEVPDSITFNYTQLLQRNIDLTGLSQLINLNMDLLFERFGKRKFVRLTGFITGDKINVIDHKRLCAAGFLGSSLAPSTYGSEAARESVYANFKDFSYWWPDSIEQNSISRQILQPADLLNISLTFRQQQIANLVTHRGLTNHQIAKQLGISDSTVKLHLGIVLKKYGVQHRTQLAALLK